MLLLILFSLLNSKELSASPLQKCMTFVDDDRAYESCRYVHNMDCVYWAYENNSEVNSKAEAAESCSHIWSKKCVDFVFSNPKIQRKSEATDACRFVTSMPCVNFVFKSPSIADEEEAAAACSLVNSIECVEAAWKDPTINTREEAAASCRELP